MRNYRNYNREERESKVFRIGACVMLAALCAGVFLLIYEAFFVPKYEPDVIIPMANQHIEWTGAGYGG